METNKEIIAQLERSFEIMEEVVFANIGGGEEASREAIKKDIEQRLANASDPFERGAIVDAYNKLKSMSFEELEELASILEEDEPEGWEEDDNEDWGNPDENQYLRNKYLTSEHGDRFNYFDEDGFQHYYQLEFRFILDDLYYCLLWEYNPVNETISNPKFFEYVFVDGPKSDKLVEVSDEKLLKSLKRIGLQYMEEENDILKEYLRYTYDPEPARLDNIQLPEDIEDLAEIIAENVHENWAKKRIEEGWSYGERRDDELKQTPCLVPYDKLPEEEKEYDRKTALETLKLIIKLGYDIKKKNG